MADDAYRYACSLWVIA